VVETTVVSPTKSF